MENTVLKSKKTGDYYAPNEPLPNGEEFETINLDGVEETEGRKMIVSVWIRQKRDFEAANAKLEVDPLTAAIKQVSAPLRDFPESK